jgi:transposase
MKSFEVPLDIPDVEIETVETDKKGNLIITVRSTVEGTNCHKCGKKITQSHGCDKPILLRHLPVLGRATYIRLRPQRYECPECENKPTTTQKSSWYHPRSPHTKVYEKHVLLQLINSTISDVSIKEDLGYEAIAGVINRHIEPTVDWRSIKRLEILGIDEISLKKGHQDFVTIITARTGETITILAVLEGRKKETVKDFFISIPSGLRKTVRVVCSDMYDGFINAAKEVFGKKVKIVADRFHVAKLYRKSLEELRKSEMKRLKKELSEAEYKSLKGVMWMLRKNKENLSSDEQKTLELLFKHSPLLTIAYDLRNELTDIFEEDISKAKAKRKIEGWMDKVIKSELTCFDSFLKTLSNRMDEITNYFFGRDNSGFVEGMNNKIKVIKRRCYGILNVENLFQRIHLDVSGYSSFI